MLTAQAQAVAAGQDTPVDSMTSQISSTVASPDGSFTTTTNLMPVRVKHDDVWTPVDATLSANTDGTYSPKATPNDVSLSGGGSGPLVTLTHADGHSMALTMPFTLPAPTVTGDTALYTSVLPGTDLSVSVTDQGGFSDVLIVHDAAAAANPQIKKLTLAASTQGLTLNSSDSGGMEATTSDGALDYSSPQPLMWDSSTSTSFAQSSTATKFLRANTTSDELAESGDDTVSSTAGPGPGAQVAPVPMTTSPSALTLTPDTSALTGPDVHYPVFLDPYTNPHSNTSGHYDEVYSSSTCSNSPQYDKGQPGGEGVGYQRWGGACGNGIERSYYAIPTGGLDPSMVVSKALVTVSSTYAASWDCSQNQPITLHTTGSISKSTDWDSKPGTVDGSYAPVSTKIASAANSGSSCSNHTASFTVTSQAQKIADNHSTADDYWTVALFGNESSSSSDYLRMSSVLTLTTTFDIPPSIPTSPHTTPTAAGADATCATNGDGWIGATTYSDAGSNIQLHSTVKTNMTGELVKALYHVWDRNDLDASGNAADKSTPDSGYVSSGTDADVKIGFTLEDGHEYGWDVYAQDNAAAHLTSPTSDHCWFKTDLTPPNTPDLAPNQSFPSVGSGSADPVVYAGPGKTTDFTVTAADVTPADTCSPGVCLASGVDHFLWQLDSQPTALTGTKAAVTSTDTKGVATGKITIPVTHWGVHTLYVAAVDQAGNLSQTPSSYSFNAPWNPSTKIGPGDITGDGIPDLLATSSTGDLNLVPGNADPAQAVAPVQTGPLTGTPPPINGPVTVATKDDSPDRTGWNNYLIAHRGNLHGGDVDDLLAYNKQTNKLYTVKNDLDATDDTSLPLVKYSTYPGYIGKRFTDVTKDACETSTVVADDARCRAAGYNSTTWDITQLIAPGDVYDNNNAYPAVVTVENKKLWIYQFDGGQHLKHPILLGDGDWSNLTLIAPGTVGGILTTDVQGNGTVTGGRSTLWARDNTSGSLYSFPLNIDQSSLVPQLLHAPVHTALTSAVVPSGGGSICLDDNHALTDNGNAVRIYTCNGTPAQTWTHTSDGALRVVGKCLDVPQGATASGTLLRLYTCNGTAAQEWTAGATGSLVNPNSGLCLDDPKAGTANGTQVRIYTCNGTAAQNWTSTAAPGWDANPPTALSPVLAPALYPGVSSTGDVNSVSGNPDGNPDLYAVDTSGQLTEYTGTAPSGGSASFADPVSLGTASDASTHWWNLDDGTGARAADKNGALDVTATGAYTWAGDASRGKVLSLTGTTGYAAATGPAVDTSDSYSVSAWVKLNSLTTNSTFVSQAGGDNNAAGLQLYYSSGDQVWGFGHRSDDTTTGTWRAVYGSKATTGRWTHLVGVYDATAQELRLYVNGKLTGVRDWTYTPWNATGPLQIGRTVSNGTYLEYADGSISDVRIYNTALPAADAAATGDNPKLGQLS
ncbi:LamG-like jellyroll fold domain-containing protein [Streptomyces sp. NPDC059398]|uniref:LamG-like jellyroll fold domain-containing protein n=1 Tax=Streptomyces sp. NPDC059398 TaxID=3346820 RepID=UPI0036B9485E